MKRKDERMKLINIKNPCTDCLVVACCGCACKNFISMVRTLLKTYKKHPDARIIKKFWKSNPGIMISLKAAIKDQSSVKIEDSIKRVIINYDETIKYYLKVKAK